MYLLYLRSGLLFWVLQVFGFLGFMIVAFDLRLDLSLFELVGAFVVFVGFVLFGYCMF